ncbi:MAG: SAM-dependent methyltransferase [Flavobacteriaceae bacterium]|nr:SAM-dependent methyltransferase [Flavobacteriaceae bacterium]
MTGKLYLIPTSLGDGAPLETIPISIKKIIESIDVYIVENEKSARRFIKTVSSGKSQSSLTLFTLNKFTNPLEIPLYLEECYKGNNIGLLSDAGCPAVADPGAEVVKIAHEKNIKTIPLVGPSSILLAMMSSGMNGQNFAFNGYLPIEKVERKSKIKQLEKRSFDENQSQLFIETPYRNNSVLEDLYKTLNSDTKICVACDLTLPTEYIKTQTAKQWKHSKLDFHKRPAIFIIHKY